jgi:UDP-N-acetylmuramate--alanine ligase
LTEVYPAGEKPIEGADASRLAEAIRARGHRDVTLVQDRKNLAEAIGERVRPGDVVIMLGAGDITRTGSELLEVLRR